MALVHQRRSLPRGRQRRRVELEVASSNTIKQLFELHRVLWSILPRSSGFHQASFPSEERKQTYTSLPESARRASAAFAPHLQPPSLPRATKPAQLGQLRRHERCQLLSDLQQPPRAPNPRLLPPFTQICQNNERNEEQKPSLPAYSSS